MDAAPDPDRREENAEPHNGNITKVEAAHARRQRKRACDGAPERPPPSGAPVWSQSERTDTEGALPKYFSEERARQGTNDHTEARSGDERTQADPGRDAAATATPGAHMVSDDHHVLVPPTIDENRRRGYSDPKMVPQVVVEKDFEAFEGGSVVHGRDLSADPVLLELRSLFIKIPGQTPDPSVAIPDREIPDPSEADQEGTKRLLDLLKRGRDRTEEFRDMKFVYTSRREIELVEEWAPILSWHDGLRGMAQWIIHHPRNEEGFTPVPAEGIRAAYGLPDETDSGRNYVSQRDLLWLYKTFVDRQLVWSYFSDGHCRHVTHHGIPSEIIKEARDFFYDRRGRERVSFMKPDVSKRTEKKYQAMAFENMAEQRRTPEDAEITPPEPSQRIRAYMNELTRDARSSSGRSMFTVWRENVGDAVEALLEAANGMPEVYDKGIRQSISILRRFQDMPWTLYQAGNYTPRPAPMGTNNLVGVDSKAIPHLLEEGRHASLDLSKAQLAVAAKVLADRFGQNVTVVNEALGRHLDPSSNYDLWVDLISATDLELCEAGKSAIKRGTYSAVFGAMRNTILHNIAQTYAADGKRYARDRSEGFLEHPVIENLLTARDQALSQIATFGTEEGLTKDAFGRILERAVFEEADNEDLKDDHRPAVKNDAGEAADRRLLAYMMQSYEVRLMWPLFKDAIEERARDGRDRWRVMQYRYDGIILWSRRKRDRQTWIENAQETVKEQAEHLGIRTRLDVEYAP